jgi:hypothetical protein
MRLANLELFGCLETERKALRRPIENSLPNLAPLWADRNFSTNRSYCISSGVLKCEMNVAVVAMSSHHVTRPTRRTLSLCRDLLSSQDVGDPLIELLLN